MSTTETNASQAASSAAISVVPPRDIGRVEALSSEFVGGWAAVHPSGAPAHVYAVLGDEVIGSGTARISRPDLDKARLDGRLDARAYLLVFERPVSTEAVRSIQVFVVGQAKALPHSKQLKVDRAPCLRLFVMGSPRSGTSQLGSTLTNVLGLPWLGEGHAAPLFAGAADALSGDTRAENGLIRHMARENYRDIAVQAARRAYFFMHGSASFVDKTPGVPMISAAPFLLECFPDARFIFLRRNPVANISSRLVKFGGGFEQHCRDWAAAMNEWLRVRVLLPHFAEVQQEVMRDVPQRVAEVLADYIGIPEVAGRICESLQSNRLEHTGAGAGKVDGLQAGWTQEQVRAFERICGPAMRAFGYG